MKVKELIERLQQFDPELPVMKGGYEGGLCDIKKVTKIEVVLKDNH